MAKMVAIDQLGAGLHPAALGTGILNNELDLAANAAVRVDLSNHLHGVDEDTPYVAAGPERSVCIPRTSSFDVTRASSPNAVSVKTARTIVVATARNLVMLTSHCSFAEIESHERVSVIEIALISCTISFE
jgi:hypothetical protein